MSKQNRHPRATRKPGCVDAFLVDRKAVVRVLPERLPRIRRWLRWSIARIIRANHYPAIFLRRFFKPLERNFTARAGIERVKNRPLARWGVTRGEIQGVALRGVIRANYLFDDLALGFLFVGSG